MGVHLALRSTKGERLAQFPHLKDILSLPVLSFEVFRQMEFLINI